MTDTPDTPEPTDADIQHLVQLAEQIFQADHESEDVAAQFLRSGEVTLAPKPPKRFNVEKYTDGWAVRERNSHPVARWWDVPDAQQRAEALTARLNREGE